MNFLLDIGHPAHVHYFRNLYFELKKDHNIIITCKSLPIINSLLTHYGIDFIEIGTKKTSIITKALKQLHFNYQVFSLLKKNKIDIAFGVSASIVHASLFSKTKSILFDDDDQLVQPFTQKYVSPYADFIVSPESLRFENLKHCIYYPGYHELAYLHPNWFIPDVSVLNRYGISVGEKYFVLRFNAFHAHHDIGMGGMSMAQKRELINLLSSYGRVFITTEKEINEEFSKYRCPVKPFEMHSFLNFSTMFVSDSQTMTSEAAVLGIPSLRCNSFVGKIAYLEEQESKYGLTFGFLPVDFDKMLTKINELLSNENIKQDWAAKRDLMLSEKIDVTSFWIWLIRNYPHSMQQVNSPEFSFADFK